MSSPPLLHHPPPAHPMTPPTPPAGNNMCQRCGTDVSYVVTQSAQRALELESQVRLLTDKATAAADKLADYEDELRRLKTSSPAPHPDHEPPSRPPSALQSRFSAFLPLSKRPPSQPPTPGPPGAFPAPDPPDLQAALTHETALRVAAETRFSKAQEEIEELSTQLFAEANEMVAEERRERKRLEEEMEREREEGRRVEGERRGLRERVEGLEKRAREREGRWEELERRVRRGERVRGLLAEAGG